MYNNLYFIICTCSFNPENINSGGDISSLKIVGNVKAKANQTLK